MIASHEVYAAIYVNFGELFIWGEDVFMRLDTSEDHDEFRLPVMRVGSCSSEGIKLLSEQNWHKTTFNPYTSVTVVRFK